ncbi:hypothetical protein [Caldimonas sp. KR1-144]|uniref:hypothetical protein n=1 Tax=Caldimonas sp. KR1-144 TaxID=3400911 RepID=UPI003BFDC916
MKSAWSASGWPAHAAMPPFDAAAETLAPRGDGGTAMHSYWAGTGHSGLAVGVTGHRPPHLAPEHLARLRAQAQQLLRGLREAQGPTVRPRLVSALAEGADRHLAELALADGYTLHAVLPFLKAQYAADFGTPASVHEFERLLLRAWSVLELPGDRAHGDHAYEAAGHAVLEQSDVLIAVWDGAPARGRGGTAAMVVEAWRRRVPVLHLSARCDAAPTLLWAADEDAANAPLDLERLPDQPCDHDVLCRIVASRTARR